MAWSARLLTLFPEIFPGPLGESLAGQALDKGLWRLSLTNIRDFASDRHRTVDDTPYGGGAGMVLRPDVVDRALTQVRDEAAALGEAPRAIYLTPRGRLLRQDLVRDLAEGPGVVLLCGRYEGVDERVLEKHALEEVSVGDIVLSGGEVAAILLLDAVVRLLPGVMGNAASAAEESFGEAYGGLLLEHPHYTRPAVWEGRAVPEALQSGHHGRIADWRREAAEETTRARRPDLWERYRAAGKVGG